ncbi:11366_t:CDS:2 [Funneliformis geosporum]|uniref:14968_t:CDS:1 n=1 Tax=Funneliformis geosporum TaxID=1117311 RepID=A0A9W4SIS9_9GLOM|nr:11366_t:CDS:2 [Funneliformis geosporum]CAI2170090.1 14968_t:CDS:2 [Funneliformis geosporum]
MSVVPRALIRYSLVALPVSQAIDKIRFWEEPGQVTADWFSRHPLSQGPRSPLRKTVTISPSAGYDDVARTSHDSIDHYLRYLFFKLNFIRRSDTYNYGQELKISSIAKEPLSLRECFHDTELNNYSLIMDWYVNSLRGLFERFVDEIDRRLF